MQIKHIPQLHNMQLVNPKSQSHARCKVELVSPTVSGGASVLVYLHKSPWHIPLGSKYAQAYMLLECRFDIS